MADNLFNPDPYLQQGGDMVRVGGMTYACDPQAKIGQRISDMRLGGRPMDAGTRYKVAGWAPVAEGAAGRAGLGPAGTLPQGSEDHRAQSAQPAPTARRKLDENAEESLIAAASLALAGCAGTGGSLTDPVGPDKVVYHLNEGLAQATNGLRNIRNHLEVNPKAQIVVVAHAQGVDYLMKGKKDAAGNPYEVIVQDLKSQGVKFDVCEITLRNRKLTKDQFIEEVVYVPSGVAEITRLQQREGFSYLRP